MKWTKFTLETTTEAVDLVSNLLCELGIEGIEIIDNIQITEQERKQLFIDFLPELNADDGTAKVSFYIDIDEDAEKILDNVRNGLKELSEFIDIGSGDITVTETEDKDWINNWKQFFKPFRIDDTIVIKPTWEQLPEQMANDLVIEIDPGTSFGTGSHETTKLCILSLKKYLKSNSVVLDAGSGSGILSIIAKKLGAKEVTGIDIDPIATDAALENARVNHLSAAELINTENGLRRKADDQKQPVFIPDNPGKPVSTPGKPEQPVNTSDNPDLCFITGNIIEDEGIRRNLGANKYDLVVANILADVIISLSGIIGENIKPGGIFISSGIINTKEEAVREALLNNGFQIIEVKRMGDWVCFTAREQN